jgi:hypothetical protein
MYGKRESVLAGKQERSESLLMPWMTKNLSSFLRRTIQLNMVISERAKTLSLRPDK